MIASMKGDSIDDLDARFASFKRDAEAGDAEAQFNLGLCYANGSGVAVDTAEAVKWYKRAAEAGYASAQCKTGASYFNVTRIAVHNADLKSVVW